MIEASQETHTKIRFTYNKSEAYQTHYANGAYGAVSPHGDFEFNFYYEHKDIPKEEVMTLENGILESEEQTSTDVIINRDLKVGIIMTTEQAESLSKWLIETLDDFRDNLENDG
ncbi:MAG TPA: hypothetical protein C5S50_01330 [Methanosarcinaceae archaeon]|nr:hypothetical protein [Methanosarcinaceae archaeon]HJH30848.1 hypothetical protein [Methanosarcinaceae archaeon]